MAVSADEYNAYQNYASTSSAPPPLSAHSNEFFTGLDLKDLPSSTQLDYPRWMPHCNTVCWVAGCKGPLRCQSDCLDVSSKSLGTFLPIRFATSQCPWASVCGLFRRDCRSSTESSADELPAGGRYSLCQPPLNYLQPLPFVPVNQQTDDTIVKRYTKPPLAP